eukprot:jgi/Chlat1/5361/Chrsp35S05284
MAGSMAATTMAPVIRLGSGAGAVAIPMLGLGTWQSEPGQVGKAVRAAFDAGYRHIDCAAAYSNQDEVGAALAERIKAQGRDSVFVTSKLWNTDHRDVMSAAKHTLSDLKLDYLDLYLVHWPIAFNASGKPDPSWKLTDTWKQMETLQDKGLAKAIGVSNCTAKQLDELLKEARIPPPQLLQYCKDKGIHMTAYSPIGSGRSGMLEDPTIVDIAKRLNRTPAQVALRWNVQRGVVVIPKSVTPNRIVENADIFSFELTEEDMKAIGKLDKGERLIKPGWATYFDQ